MPQYRSLAGGAIFITTIVLATVIFVSKAKQYKLGRFEEMDTETPSIVKGSDFSDKVMCRARTMFSVMPCF